MACREMVRAWQQLLLRSSVTDFSTWLHVHLPIRCDLPTPGCQLSPGRRQHPPPGQRAVTSPGTPTLPTPAAASPLTISSPGSTRKQGNGTVAQVSPQTAAPATASPGSAPRERLSLPPWQPLPKPAHLGTGVAAHRPHGLHQLRQLLSCCRVWNRHREVCTEAEPPQHKAPLEASELFIR